MRNSQEKETVLPEKTFNAADDRRTVRVPNFLGNYAYRVSALYAKLTGKKIRTIIQFARGRQNAVLGAMGKGMRSGGIVQNGGNRSGRKANVIGNGLQRHCGAFFGGLHLTRWHLALSSKSLQQTNTIFND